MKQYELSTIPCFYSLDSITGLKANLKNIKIKEHDLQYSGQLTIESIKDLVITLDEENNTFTLQGKMLPVNNSICIISIKDGWILENSN